MARKLASVATIRCLSPIENSDFLEVAEMEESGWRVVVRKGELSIGEKVVYYEIDSALNPDDPRYEFLRERCLRKFVSKSGNVLREVIRIKTIKLRGVISQGLILPIRGNFPELHDAVSGQDVTEYLGVEHYDEIAEMLRPSTGGGGVSADAYGPFPSDYIPKTDEERVQNLPHWFAEMKGRRWEITEKNDGSSITMFFSPTIDADNPFGVCSRNIRLKDTKSDGTRPLPWLMADKYGVCEKLKTAYENGFELAFQGELVGPGIQCDRDKYIEHEWHVFRIWDIRKQSFVSPSERRAICAQMKIPHVHVIAESMPFFDKITTMDYALKFAEGKTTRGNEREGVVLKTSDDGPFRSFKIVSNRYLLKQE